MYNPTVAAEQVTDHIRISVSDEGVGMTQDQIKNIMADQFIVSSSNMDNRKGKGTTVSLYIYTNSLQ